MEWYVVMRPRRSRELLEETGAESHAGVNPRRKKVQQIVAASAVVLTGVTLGGYYTLVRKTVTLVVDGHPEKVVTWHRRVEGVLQQAGIALGPHDRVLPGTTATLKNGMQVEIRHAVPATLEVDGKKLRLYTCANDVEGLLQEAGVKLGPDDLIDPAKNAPVRPDMLVKVTRVTKEVVEKKVPVPYEVKRQYTSALYQGETRVVAPGTEGEALERWEIVRYDGQIKEEKLIDKQVVRPPEARVVEVGTLQEVSRGGENLRFSRVVVMRATAYSYDAGYYTATGIPVRRGIAAVDPRVIPLGTRLYVEGYGYALAADTGGAIKGNAIDLFFPTSSEVYNWGVKYVKVYVLE
ncbi:ubiquitin-like domain-containing protein [Desulfothermobacter acidiphilus]|uniref:ubiquitin-like domain-containing protein n=1 Tax=Desulfothermobacter acidiphilus TaxID=1938353 RepID=UPI003F8928FD